MSEPARKHEDSPEVAALRKRIRREPLTPTEEALLAQTSRKPPESEEAPIPHAEVERMLAERERRGE